MRRTLPHRTVLPGTVLLALVVATLASSGSAAAQTLTVHTPDTLHVGQSVIVRPEPRDVIDRPTSVSRVLAVPLVPGPLDVSYASGGQRFTARQPGAVPVLWLWDRTDGRRLLQLDTVLVVAAPDTAPPPVIVPPVIVPPVIVPPDTAPPDTAPPVVVMQKLNISQGGAQLERGATQTLSAWATATEDGRFRTATTAELRAADLRWTTADTTVARVARVPGAVEQATLRGVSPGRTTARVCAPTLGLCSPGALVTVRPAPSDTATPVVPPPVVTPPVDTAPPVPPDTTTPPVVPPPDTTTPAPADTATPPVTPTPVPPVVDTTTPPDTTAADTTAADTVPHPPALPRDTVDVTLPLSTRTIRVPAGGNLQAALDTARGGDEIVLDAGAEYRGSFKLRPRPATDTGWIVVRSSGTLPAPGTRVTPADSAQLARLVSPIPVEPVVETLAGAHHVRLVGLEITADSTATLAYSLVELGEGGRAQNTLAAQPHHLTLDRSYVHGTPTLNFQRCVALNAAWVAIVDSWLSECHSRDVDSQAIGGWNGTGPYRIENNRLEGAAENILLGGADPAIPDAIASDVVIRRNHVVKPMAWQGQWVAKNLLELKLGRRLLIEGNVFENSWRDGQTGFAVVMWSVNQGGKCPWCVTEDVTFRNNLILNAAGGFQLTERYSSTPSLPMQRVRIANTLALGIGGAGLGSNENGAMYQIGGAIQDLTLDHNTGLSTRHGIVFASGRVIPLPRFTVTNNILGGGGYQIFSSFGQGLTAWTKYAGPGSTFDGNVVVVRGGSLPLPPGNARVTAAALALGSDGVLPAGSTFAGAGADVAAVLAATAGVVVVP